MNIDITKDEHEYLSGLTFTEHVFGSKMYGTDCPDSDTDILRIFIDPNHWVGFVNSYPNIHQFKYTDKERNIDYIYTTIDQFWKNQRTGDSIINSELVMFSEKFHFTPIERVQRVRTYKVLKAFLGFAKRDIKNGKFWHADRCLNIVDQVLFRNQLPDLVGDIRQSYDIFKDKPGQTPDIKRQHKDYLTKHQKSFRNILNLKFENNEINMYFVPDVHDSLLQKLLNSNNTKEFQEEQIRKND